MEQYIPKSALLAKIEKIREYANENWDIEEVKGIDKFIDKLESYINTLEMKEVDLEKEIDNYINNNFFGSQSMGFFANRTKEEPNDRDMALCAKHFFELGLKAQNKDNE